MSQSSEQNKFTTRYGPRYGCHGAVIVFLIIMLMMVACSQAPPRKEIEISGSRRQAFSGDKTGKPFVDIVWWKSFGDEGLTGLVNSTLEKSPDARHALLNVEAFRQRVIKARAPLLPGVNISGDAGRSRQHTPSMTGHEKSYEVNNFGLLITAAYEVDLWNKIANSAETARLALMSSEENLKTVYQTLTANVAWLYFDISELEEELPIWDKLLKVTSLQARDAQRGYFNGLVSGNTYLTIQQREDKARQDLHAARRKLSVLRFSLNTLMGKEPAVPISVAPFSNFEGLLRPLPAGLPSRLLNRRPDVRMAALEVRQALLNIGIKRADLLPSLKLTANAGYRSSELSRLINEGSSVWSIMGGLLQPVFYRGAKKAAVKQAEIEADMAVERYRKVALNAFREVESALSIYEELASQLAQEKQAYRNETIVYRRVHNGYLSGTRSFQEFLSAMISLLKRKIIVNQLILHLLENRVQLYTALGGGVSQYEKISGVTHE